MGAVERVEKQEMKHNYQQVSKSTGAVLITFSIFLICFDSAWVWMDWYARDKSWRCNQYDNYQNCYYGRYFDEYTWTWGVGIFCGILGLTAGSLGVSVAKHEELVDFFAKFGPTAVMGNVAGSFAVLCYGWITWCTGAHLYEMEYVYRNSYKGWSFFAGFISVVICEWIFFTLIMVLCFFQANFFGCTCCCKDPTEGGAIEPVNVMAAPQMQYPQAINPAPVAVPYAPYPTMQPPMQQVHMQQMAPVYGQPAQAPYGMYAPNQAPKKEDLDSSSSSDSSSDEE